MTPTGEGAGLVCTGLIKAYGGVRVLKEVDFTLAPGDVVGLIGENGAGKSTLSSLISGVIRPDGGTMTLDGAPYAPAGPAEALGLGVALIHQEIRLVPDLSVAENIFLGRLPLRGGRVDRELIARESEEVLRSLGAEVDPRRPVRGLSMAVQQEIEIAKALTRRPRYVVFDEPSASLGEAEAERIFEQIKVLRTSGAGVVFISHRLDEIKAVANRIICLRDGNKAAEWATGNVAKADMVNAMVGREFTFEHHPPQPSREAVVLQVRELGRSGAFDGITFDLTQGEVLGIAGLVGAGRTEVVRVIAGVDKPDTGEVVISGQQLKHRGPKEAIQAGIVMVPEDRKGQGLHLGRSAGENLALPWESELAKTGLVTNRVIDRLATAQRERFDIRGDLSKPVQSMSGGNQQKVLIAKWLVKDPKVLIVDEPTRGVDVGAKMAIYEIIRNLAASGMAVIVVSSELEEVLGLCHRVLVMAGGRQRGILSREEATPRRVMELAVPSSQPLLATEPPLVAHNAGG